VERRGLSEGGAVIFELLRKAFHMLSLAYLAAYWLLGYPLVVWWLAGWAVIVTAIETARLFMPSVRKVLEGALGMLMRESERGSFSGIFHTTVGSLGLVLLAGDKPRIFTAALLYLALGDAAAALVGRAWGRHKLMGGRKSVEGALANFFVCLACGLAVKLPLGAALIGAAAASAVELIPNNRFWNDNLWLPVLSAGALLCAA
jgi:dolichol kinase